MGLIISDKNVLSFPKIPSEVFQNPDNSDFAGFRSKAAQRESPERLNQPTDFLPLT